MPKKLKYESYNLISGISQSTDDQTFVKLLLSRVENLRYIKEDALISIDSYQNLGIDENLGETRFIDLQRYKNTLLGFTKDKIYRFDETERAGRKFKWQEVGDYLNADVTTDLIVQEAEDVLDPAIGVFGDLVYVAYRSKGRIFHKKYNLKTGSFEGLNLPLFSYDNSKTNYESLKFEIDFDLPEATGVKLLVYDSDRVEYETYPYDFANSYNLGQPVFTATGDKAAFGTLKDQHYTGNFVQIGGRGFFKSLGWGRFRYAGNNYRVIYSPRDGYYIVKENLKGTIVGKIGLLNSPDLNEKYFTNPANFIIQGNSVYFPVLLNTNEQAGEGINKIEYPVGFYIIRLTFSDVIPQFKTYEYGSGLLLSGPIVQNYDGRDFTEFNFCHRPQDIQRIFPVETKIHDTDVVLQFQNVAGRTYQSGTDVGVSASSETTEVETFELDSDREFSAREFERQSDGSKLRFNYSGSQLQLEDDATATLINYVDRSSRNSLLDVYSGGEAEDDDFQISRFTINPTDNELVSFQLRIRVWDDDLDDFYSDNNVHLILANSREDAEAGRCVIWDLGAEESGSDPEQRFSDISPVYDNLDIDFNDPPLRAFFRKGYTQTTTGTSTAENVLSSSAVRLANSPYQVKVSQGADYTEFEISKDGSDPPELLEITTAVINQGNNSESYTLAGSQQRTDGNKRIFRVAKGSLDLDANNSDYQIGLTVRGDRKWVNRYSASISKRDFDGSDLRIDDISVNDEGNKVSITFNDIALFNRLFTDKKSFLTLEIDEQDGGVDTIYLFADSSTEEGNVKIWDIGSVGRGGIPVGQLIVGDTEQAPADQEVKINFWSLANSDQDLGFLPINQYLYSGYFKWRDPSAKEHISPLANPLNIVQFGEVGTERRDSNGILKGSKVMNQLRFHNLNLTTKQGVSFVLLRADANATGGDNLYRIVKEVDVNVNGEYLDIIDDVPRSQVRGAVSSRAYDSIIQPPGCRTLAVGRWNRMFLGGIIGVENGILISNFLSNNSVDVFSFKAEPGIDIFRRFDHKVIGIERLDSNVIVFTERAFFNIAVESLNVYRIQQSETNFATQKEGIVPWFKGIAYFNDKGLQYIGRDFNSHWMSKKVIDEVETQPIPIDTQVDFNPAIDKIISAKGSIKDREVRFRLASKETNEDRGYLVFNTEYFTWVREKSILGPEQEILGERFKTDQDGHLFVSVIGRENQNDKKWHTLETGWLNYADAKKSALIRNIDIIGNFGNFAPESSEDSFDTGFFIQLWYDDNENAEPEYSKVVSLPNSEARRFVRISPKKQKNSSIKIKVSIFTDVCKLSAIGFQLRSQTAGSKVGTGQNF